MESWADIARAESGYDYGQGLDFSGDDLAEWAAESEGGVLDHELVNECFERDAIAEARQAAEWRKQAAQARHAAVTQGRNAAKVR